MSQRFFHANLPGRLTRCALAAMAVMSIVFIGACSSNQTEGAAKGAGTGAIAGAAGAMVGALVFGGDVGEAALRGAVVGGTSGAVVGGISGTEKDKREAEARAREQQKQLDALRKKLGDDAYEGAGQLVKCKHDIAMAYGETAAKSSNPDYAAAGLWLQALTLDDRGAVNDVEPMLQQIIQADREVADMDTALAALARGRGDLAAIRQQFGYPPTCE